MYKYETHCHTACSSACATVSSKDLVELYVANGYTGVFITDHFLNGNTTVHRKLPNGTYEEKIEEFCKGYREVKECAKDRIDVFFGLEMSYKGSDILIYGYDEESLKKASEIVNMRFSAVGEYCKKNGLLAVHAHPFREDYYIDHIRLYPNLEGVEVFNSSRNELCNNLGKMYADAYGKIVQTGGSDLHHVTQRVLSGMEFDEKIVSEKHFIELLQAGKGKIFHQENCYIK